MKSLLLLPVTAVLLSCQPTKITQSWAVENTSPKKYKKVLVLGIMPAADSQLQKQMENHLADDLRAMGYLAIASNKVFSVTAFGNGDSVYTSSLIKNNGFEGVLTIVLIDKQKNKYYVPGKITNYSEYDGYSRFNKYYNTVSEQVFTPGYYGEETRYTWENNFYNIGNGYLIYSTRTRSFDYTSKTILAHTYGQLMIQNLLDKNILIKPDASEE
jgi:hypothetical protein